MELTSFRWLHIPFHEVAALLRDRPIHYIEPAVAAGAERAGEVLTNFDVDFAGVEVAVKAAVEVGEVEMGAAPLPIVRLPVRWHAIEHAGMFPVMDATVEAYPVDDQRTQLGFQGFYQPPLGKLGAALDSLLLHRVAEATVERFLEVVAHNLKRAHAEGVPGHPTEGAEATNS